MPSTRPPTLEHRHDDGWRRMESLIERNPAQAGTRSTSYVLGCWRYRCTRDCHYGRYPLRFDAGTTGAQILEGRPEFRTAVD